MEKKENTFIHNLLIVLGAIWLIEVTTITGIVCAYFWFIENGI